MRKEHRPLSLIRFFRWLNALYVRRILAPQFDRIGKGLKVLHPQSLTLFGKNISAGDHLHLISNKSNPISISTWTSKQEQGHIQVGNYCLISPGVKIISAVSISVGNSCMIAGNVYISDSDWHGIYNRTRPYRCSAPIIIGDNVWIGYQSIIGKGVTIGENSVIGAGSVVIGDIPENVIAAGNPATIIRKLDTKKRMLTREFLFSGNADYWENQHELEKYLFTENSYLKWIKSLFSPTPND